MIIPKPIIHNLLIHKPIIYTNIVSTIIAPHGITDIIHSYQQNKTKELLLVNTCVTTTSYLLSLQDSLINIVDISFIISTIIHFRHDIHCILNVPKYIWSSLLLLISIYISHDLFYFYMCFIHVPKHYHFNIQYIKKNITINFLIILTTTFISNNLFLLIDDIYDYPIILSISKGIIISHILYEELYIHNQ